MATGVDVVSVREAARTLGRTEWGVRQLMADGELRTVRVRMGSRTVPQVEARSLARYLNKQDGPPRAA